LAIGQQKDDNFEALAGAVGVGRIDKANASPKWDARRI